MSLLKKWEKDGLFQGIPIGENKEDQLLYQLFDDDMGMFFLSTRHKFQATMKVIGIYKRIFWARLNLEKSILVPLDDKHLPSWYASTGYRIARPGEVITCLGSPMGCKITTSKEAEFLWTRLGR